MTWSKLVPHIFLDARSIRTMYLAHWRIHFPKAGKIWGSALSVSTAGSVLSPASRGQRTDNTHHTMPISPVPWRRTLNGLMLPEPEFSKTNSSSA